jgi:hypothetical protein
MVSLLLTVLLMLLLLLKITPRVSKFVVEFVAIGFNELQRAILETERRFCGNQTEELSHDNVTLNDREKMPMLLDLKTLPCNNVEKEVRK